MAELELSRASLRATIVTDGGTGMVRAHRAERQAEPRRVPGGGRDPRARRPPAGFGRAGCRQEHSGRRRLLAVDPGPRRDPPYRPSAGPRSGVARPRRAVTASVSSKPRHAPSPGSPRASRCSWCSTTCIVPTRPRWRCCGSSFRYWAVPVSSSSAPTDPPRSGPGSRRRRRAGGGRAQAVDRASSGCFAATSRTTLGGAARRASLPG